jgi:hypothetical protein
MTDKNLTMADTTPNNDGQKPNNGGQKPNNGGHFAAAALATTGLCDSPIRTYYNL